MMNMTKMNASKMNGSKISMATRFMIVALAMSALFADFLSVSALQFGLAGGRHMSREE